jgi:hypothetical protein
LYNPEMMLYHIIDGGYLGFYHEYGGKVHVSGTRTVVERRKFYVRSGGRWKWVDELTPNPIYSYTGLSDEYRLLKPLRKRASEDVSAPRREVISCRITGTEELLEFEVDFVCYTKTLGENKYVDPRRIR